MFILWKHIYKPISRNVMESKTCSEKLKDINLKLSSLMATQLFY